MESLRNSVAWRLTVWFLLLSFLPIGVMAVFVRRTVAEAFVDLVARETRTQSKLLATELSLLRDDDAAFELLALNSGENRTAFLLNEAGNYLFHPSAPKIASSAFEDYPGEIIRQVLAGGEGAVVDPEADRLLGFAPIPAKGSIVAVEIPGAVISAPLLSIERASFIQLAMSMLIVSLVGGAAIWILIGPIRQLTNAAHAVGAGDLAVEVDPSDMEGELEVLTVAFNDMTRQLRDSYANLERRVADRTKELAALNRIAAVVSRSLELEEVLQASLDTAMEVTGFESGAIYCMEPQKGELQMGPYRGLSSAFRAQVEKGIISARVAQTGEPILHEDLREVPEAPHEVVAEGYRTVASIPLVSKGQVEGVLTLAGRQIRRFKPQDINLLDSIGNQIGVTMENARLYETEQRRAEHFRLINEVGRRIASILDADELLVQIARLIREAFGVYHVGIGLVEGDEVIYKVGAGALWEDPEFNFQPARLKVAQEGITGWVAGSGQPLLAPDVSREPNYVEMRGSKTRSELAVPIMSKGEVLGVLDVQSDRLNAFDETDLAVFQSLAHQAGGAIDNARLYQTEQRRAEQLRVINEVGRRITSILTVDRLLEQIADLIQEAFSYYLVELLLIEGEEVILYARAGRDLDPNYAKLRLKVGREGIVGWVAAEGEPCLVPDVSREPRYLQLSETETRSELAVPIRTKDKIIGVLNIESDRIDAFDESDLTVLQSLGNQAAIAIENARLYEQARQVAALSERQRLARELHDSVTQEIYGVTMYAEAASRLLMDGKVEQAADYLQELRKTAQEAMGEMRLMIFELRPPVLEREGLIGALQARLEAVEGRTGLQTRFEVEGEAGLSPEIEEGLYRIAQEALNNALKHSQAGNLSVRLVLGDRSVSLEIADDGIGFDPSIGREEGGMGLRGMGERASQIGGKLTLTSGPEEGTIVRVEVEQ